MKKLIPILFLLLSVAAEASNNVYIPDSLFRVYISSIIPAAITGDSLNTADTMVQAYDSMNIAGLGISNLQGVQYFTSLRALKADHNNLGTLPVFSNSLKNLIVNNNQLFSITALPAALHYLVCSNNNMVALTTLPATLYTLDCRNNKLLCLPTLPDTLSNLLAANNYMSCLTNVPAVAGFSADIASNGPGYTVCDSNTCDRYNVIRGRAFWDANNNGVYDAGEQPIPNQIVNIQPLGEMTVTDSGGFYAVNSHPGVTETVVIHPGAHLSVSPASSAILQTNLGTDTATLNFAYYYAVNDSFSDVKVQATEVVRAVPGYATSYSLKITNQGARTEQGRLVFVFVPAWFTYNTSTPSAAISGDTLIWNFSNLNPGTSLYYNFSLNVRATAATGLVFNMPAYVTIENTDSVPANNVAYINDTIVHDYIRNNKTVSPKTYTAANFNHGDYFDYTITFQNTGTNTAAHALIVDTLSQYFDMSTIMVVAASATYRLTITDHVLNVDFDNIHLPDSTQNKLLSHGFFRFLIRPLTIDFVGTLRNKAYIYFDGQLAATSNCGAAACFSSLSIGTYSNPEVFNYCLGNTLGSATVGVNSGQPPYAYTWSSGSNGTTAPNLVVGTYYVTVTDACAATAMGMEFVDSAFAGCNGWIGNSAVWNDASNWSLGVVPNGCAADVYLASGKPHYPLLGSNVSVGKVEIKPGASINLNGFELGFCGDLIVPSTGLGITGSGKLSCQGTSAQTLTGNLSIDELEINNNAGVRLQSGAVIKILSFLDLMKGNFDVSAGSITFKSTSVTSAAVIDDFSPGYTGTLTGSIHAERYFNTSYTFKQRFMGSPVSYPSLSQLNAYGSSGFILDSICDENTVQLNSPYGNVFGYDEANGAGCSMEQWYCMTSGALEPGKGYSYLVNGYGTITLSGAANLLPTYTVSGYNSNWNNTTLQGHARSSGWQLFSNPYLATLNLTHSSPGFDAQVQVWVPYGPYAWTYQPSVIGSAVIAPFQAFMMHVSAPNTSASYTIYGSDRTRSAANFYDLNSNALTLTAKNLNTGLLDKTIIAFDANASDGFDAQMDAEKFSGALNRHTLYSVSGTKWMSRNMLHDVATTATVAVGMEPGATGNYTISFDGVSTFDPTVYITLEDLRTQTLHDARSGDYTFSADSGEARDRFVLHFTPPAIISTTDANCNTGGSVNIQQPGLASWNYTLTDINGQSISTGTLSESTPVNLNLAPGNYVLAMVDAQNYTAVKTFVINGTQPVVANFQPSSASVQVQQPVDFTSTSTGAISYSWNFGNGTTATGANATATYTQPGTYTVALVITNDAGCTSTKTQTITVSALATGLSAAVKPQGLNIWSSGNNVYVDFGTQTAVDAKVIIYNVLGQELCNEHLTSNTLFQKQVANIEAAYVIVTVKEQDKITTRKVFIINDK